MKRLKTQEELYKMGYSKPDELGDMYGPSTTVLRTMVQYLGTSIRNPYGWRPDMYVDTFIDLSKLYKDT